MRIIAFITFSANIYKMLEHIGVAPEAPRITPARAPPLWDECDAPGAGESVEKCGERLAQLTPLCPGDFAAVKRPGVILDAEHRIKPEVPEGRAMGFMR